MSDSLNIDEEEFRVKVSSKLDFPLKITDLMEESRAKCFIGVFMECKRNDKDQNSSILNLNVDKRAKQSLSHVSRLVLK